MIRAEKATVAARSNRMKIKRTRIGNPKKVLSPGEVDGHGDEPELIRIPMGQFISQAARDRAAGWTPLPSRPDQPAQGEPEQSEAEPSATPDETKYTDEAQLRSAVLKAARSEWRHAAGRDMTDHDRANFENRVLPEHERRALKIGSELSDVLVKLAAFATDYQRVPGTQTVMDGDGNELPVSLTFETRRLLRVVEEDLPAQSRSIFETGLMDLDGRCRDSEGKSVAISPTRVNASGGRVYRIPRLVNWLKHQPGGWTVGIRGRVVSLLADPNPRGYWYTLGLSKRADDRTMAFASLLLGAWPSINRLADGVTVDRVIEREAAAVRAAKARIYPSPRKRKRPPT